MSSELSTTRIGPEPGENHVLVNASRLEMELIAHAVWDIARAGRLNSDVHYDVRPGDLTVVIDGRTYTTNNINLIYIDGKEHLLIEVNEDAQHHRFFLTQREPESGSWSIPEGSSLVSLEADEDEGGEAFFGLSDSLKLKMLLG